jgi:hypothetical protein
VVVNKTTGETGWTGLAIDMLNMLKSELNFTYEIVTPASNEMGMRKPDGNWTGLMGMLVRKAKIPLII